MDGYIAKVKNSLVTLIESLDSPRNLRLISLISITICIIQFISVFCVLKSAKDILNVLLPTLLVMSFPLKISSRCTTCAGVLKLHSER